MESHRHHHHEKKHDPVLHEVYRKDRIRKTIDGVGLALGIAVMGSQKLQEMRHSHSGAQEQRDPAQENAAVNWEEQRRLVSRRGQKPDNEILESESQKQ